MARPNKLRFSLKRTDSSYIIKEAFLKKDGTKVPQGRNVQKEVFRGFIKMDDGRDVAIEVSTILSADGQTMYAEAIRWDSAPLYKTGL